MTCIQTRSYQISPELKDLHPLLGRIYAARGIDKTASLDLGLSELFPYHSLKGINEAVTALLPVVFEQKKLLVVGDFDADGATSTALVIRALHIMGAKNLDYLVPNRFDFGYGLSPELVEVALSKQPDLILTVDNGISSVEGVAAANQAGIPVIITDHHLPGQQIPDAVAIVNPNQSGCDFPSKAACGCTLAFYLMLALRAELNKQNWFVGSCFSGQPPNLAELLDLVALATVADVVPLDHNNRILVEQGLGRLRAGRGQVGVRALLQVAGKSVPSIVASDMGFAIGPRLNAAGRLDDMSLGIECLLTDDPNKAMQIAQTLDEMNQDRRKIEKGMQEEAIALIKAMPGSFDHQAGICLYQPEWHQGVIGILASRIKEKAHRPVIAFAKDDAGCLKGSARSIAGFHIRDALDLLDKEFPGLLIKFGGHAMAAGMSIREQGYAAFTEAFYQVCERLIDDETLKSVLETDGVLEVDDFNMELAELLGYAGPWGQSFPEPLFEGAFRIVKQRIVGAQHLKLVLQPLESTQMLDAIYFNVDTKRWPDDQCEQIYCAYQLDVNEFRGQKNVQLLIRHIE